MFKAVESTLCGHPNKVCDQIAEAIVDEYLRRDPQARVDIKVLASHGMLVIGGEVLSQADFDCSLLAKQIYQEIGYPDDMEVFVSLEKPSQTMQLSRASSDTVVVQGYATRETREFLPRPLVYAHDIARRLDDLRKIDPRFRWLGPDGKIQVVMEGKQLSRLTVLVQHPDKTLPHHLQSHLLNEVIIPLVGENGTTILINPLGGFTVGGFVADTGCSGLMSHVDFYGGLIPHGTASPIGKDPHRAERAGALMARFVAKDLVQKKKLDAALISLMYGMGELEPSFIGVRAIGSLEPSEDLVAFVRREYVFHLDAIVDQLKLFKPWYRSTSLYGMFGNESFPWEIKK